VTAVALALAALLAPDPLPRGRPARIALGALGLFCAWTALSAGWAPLGYEASNDAQRVLLYLVVLAIAVAVWRPRSAARWVEPVLAGGVLGVTLVGLAGRLLPGIVTQNTSLSAGGRLEQPLTYWNAEGALAAMGLVLCARIAGDRRRPRALRLAAAAATVPLAAGLYLTFSRGALAALAGGLIALVVAAPTRSQLRALAACVLPCVAGTVAAGLSDGVRGLQGSHSHQVSQGLVVLAVLVVACAAAAGLTALAIRREPADSSAGDRLGLPGWTAPVAAVVIVALVAVPIAAGGAKAPGAKQEVAFGATNQRLSEIGSNRPEYWRVALKAWEEDPLKGVGSSGFAVEWIKKRHITEGVHDAHSLEIETLAELGLVGAAILAALIGAAVVGVRRAHGADPALAAGPLAALVVWGLHASLDWDWEMPALTLVAVILLGMLLAQADRAEVPRGR
jgi:hypothetical protein